MTKEGTFTAESKADYPEVTKNIKLADNSLVDSTNANMGDTVTFVLTATMPSKMDGYEHYKIIFHDTMDAGLTYSNNVEVKLGDTNKTSDWDVTGVTSDNTITFTITDLLNKGVEAGDVITVTYTATLNQNAVIAGNGNKNKVYLEYSNNPNWNAFGWDENGNGKVDDGENKDEYYQKEPTGKTPEESVVVYTWKIPVFKYTNGANDTQSPLAGAGFTLYTDSTKPVKVVAAGNNVYKVCALVNCSESHTHVNENQITTDDTGRFEIVGLASGTYYLKETHTPAGYNTAADTEVVIDAYGRLNPQGEGDNVPSATEIGVLNQKGSTLPSTGGIGTTLFYVFGGIMVLAAVVLLITKKRMASAE